MSFEVSSMVSRNPIGILVWADRTFLTVVRGEMGQPEGLIIFVIGMHQTFGIARRTECGAEGGAVSFDASTSLHTPPGVQGC